MIKKHIIHLCALLALGGGFSSCYKDDSVESTRPLSSITLADGATIADSYTADFGQEFVLNAPDVKQAHETFPPTYRWEIYPPTTKESQGARSLPQIQTSRELRLPLNIYGTYDVNLHISNADNTYIKRFKVIVPTAYGVGLYALLNRSDKPEIGYIPAAGYDSSKESETYKEGLQLNNPVVGSFAGFPAAPSSIASFQDLQDRYITLTLVDGNTYLLNANTMQVLLRDPFKATEGEATLVSQHSGSFRGIIRNGQFYSYQASSYFYARRPRGQYLVDQRYPGTLFSAQSVIATTALGDAAVLYDETRGVLFLMQAANFFRYQPTSSNLGSDASYRKWQDGKLSAMTSYGERNQVALLMQSKTNAANFFLARFSFASGTRTEPIAFAGLQDIPSTLGVDASSRIASHRDILYLSAGHQIYAYVAGSTSFPTSPLITLPQGQRVVQMLTRVDGSNTYLYIATTDGTTSSIYYYDVTSGSTSSQVWAKTGIAGKILNIDFRLS